ncbi:hypothetical protein PG994_010041 [Apiospora phragmitis]|uniref:Uncharacterized protein n=1 Tax=Apiospora phragmitis TaxID=2905665 RepID=A0ABR1TNS2_9PEZI
MTENLGTTGSSIQISDNPSESPRPVLNEGFIREQQARDSDRSFLRHKACNLAPEPNRTTAYLQYFEGNPQHTGEKPYVSKVPPPLGQQQINFGGRYDMVMLTDVRGLESQFSLDRTGFEFVHHTPQESLSELKSNPDKGIEEYIEGMSEWLKAYLGSDEVFVFDYALRRDAGKGAPWIGVARRVHCVDVVQSSPLAMCPYQLVSPEDLVPVDIFYPHYDEEAMEVRPSEKHQWFYRSSATPEDIVLLKAYDSDHQVACSKNTADACRDPEYPKIHAQPDL